jgi:CRP/FNR family transcriptional regulator, cyclic AMP receptor protein
MVPEEDLFTTLQKVPWFSGLSPKQLKKVTELTHLRNVKAGEVFFREGDKQDYTYIVMDGRVSLDIFIPHHGKMHFLTVEPYDVFGWSSVTPDMQKRTAGAAAVLDTCVACIDSEGLQNLAEKDRDCGYLLMSRLANIIASRLMVTRLQLIDMFAGPAEYKND